MEEPIYKHNYEYLSIEEAKAIVNGTFVQGTTNIGGELATKGDIDGLLTALISDLNALTTRVSTLEASLKSLTKTVNNLPTAVTNDQKYLRKDQDDSTSYNITAKGFYKAQTA